MTYRPMLGYSCVGDGRYQGDDVTNGPQDGHLIPLPGTEWTVWRDAVLRTAGFPAAGLDRFAAPECAAVADAFIDGWASQQDVELAHATALAQASRAAAAIAA